MTDPIQISDYNYELPPERIARYPLARREDSKLLICRDGSIREGRFSGILTELPAGSLLVFNDTRVVRARLIFYKESGARIEIFCLEPFEPADYERAFAAKGAVRWVCMVGNLSKWKGGLLPTRFDYEGRRYEITAEMTGREGNDIIVEFAHNDTELTFGQLLEMLGKVPIPPYLCREAEESDIDRYQTVYSRFEGSVAAPTAGLHFIPEMLRSIEDKGLRKGYVTLHVGAGTFLPVKESDATLHTMHVEHFVVTRSFIASLLGAFGSVVAVGTTSARTLESLAVLGWRAFNGSSDAGRPVGQWEAYDMPDDGREMIAALLRYMEKNGMDRLKGSTRMMITPSYRFRVVNALITNFHQPQSTLLLLVAAAVGERWRDIYRFALDNGFRFLSYGDSSLLFVQR